MNQDSLIQKTLETSKTIAMVGVSSIKKEVSTNIRRRGLALRYIGDDVTWDDRPGTFISNEKFKNILPQLNFKKGESLNSTLFPKIWTS